MTGLGAGRLLVDSADLVEVPEVVERGLVRGITVNPKLLRAVTDKPLDHLAALLELPLDEVYYQPTGAEGADLEIEAQRAASLAPERVIVKAMATPAGSALAARLRRRDIAVALTGAQSAEAMVVAEALGCHAVIPYVDRGLRDPHVSARLIEDLAAVRAGVSPLIVAASIKTGRQVVDVLRRGADAVSAPAEVLTGLLTHQSVLAAEREFESCYAEEAP